MIEFLSYAAADADVERNLPCISRSTDEAAGSEPAAAPQILRRMSSTLRIPSKASPIVHISTAFLAFYAGFINAVGVGLVAKTIGNVTGLTTKIAADLVDGKTEYLLIVQFCSFAFGSILCGVLISSRRVGIGTELYGIVLMLVSVLVFAAWFEVGRNTDATLCLLASAMGLQNGMLTKHA